MSGRQCHQLMRLSTSSIFKRWYFAFKLEVSYLVGKVSLEIATSHMRDEGDGLCFKYCSKFSCNLPKEWRLHFDAIQMTYTVSRMLPKRVIWAQVHPLNESSKYFVLQAGFSIFMLSGIIPDVSLFDNLFFYYVWFLSFQEYKSLRLKLACPSEDNILSCCSHEPVIKFLLFLSGWFLSCRLGINLLDVDLLTLPDHFSHR